jgi:aminoglycoside phosphotransferase family enzyme
MLPFRRRPSACRVVISARSIACWTTMTTELEPDLAAKVAFLRRPGSHPERPATIEVIETHFAWVFLGDRVVRKLKKPIANHWLDFSTLERRRLAAAEEVTLNRALAPGVYLGVEALVLTDRGRLRLGGPGQPVDAIVVMRRLPAALTLDHRAAWLRSCDLAPVADHLAAFYRADNGDPADARARLDQVAGSLGNLRHRVAAGPLARRARAMPALLDFAAGARDLLRTRAEQGWVVDAHGDLRPEHVYLTTPPRILDRLEFGATLRRIDWLEDVALLAVDLECQGRAWIGHRLMTAIAQRLGDRPPLELWCFFRAWRALLRAQLAVEHLDRSSGGGDRAHWLRRGRRYLAIADRHAVRLDGRAGR